WLQRFAAQVRIGRERLRLDARYRHRVKAVQDVRVHALPLCLKLALGLREKVPANEGGENKRSLLDFDSRKEPAAYEIFVSSLPDANLFASGACVDKSRNEVGAHCRLPTSRTACSAALSTLVAADAEFGSHLAVDLQRRSLGRLTRLQHDQHFRPELICHLAGLSGSGVEPRNLADGAITGLSIVLLRFLPSHEERLALATVL